MNEMNVLKWFGIGLIAIGIALGVIGFFLPPYGVIDGSVISFFGEILAAVGVLMAWDSISEALHRGVDTTVKAGNTEITLNNPDKND